MLTPGHYRVMGDGGCRALLNETTAEVLVVTDAAVKFRRGSDGGTYVVGPAVAERVFRSADTDPTDDKPPAPAFRKQEFFARLVTEFGKR